MWQAKELREGIFGSVAKKGVTREILDVWQGKDLEDSGEWLVTSGEKGKDKEEAVSTRDAYRLDLQGANTIHITTKVNSCQAIYKSFISNGLDGPRKVGFQGGREGVERKGIGKEDGNGK